jgi:predicted phosphodiesterase
VRYTVDIPEAVLRLKDQTRVGIAKALNIPETRAGNMVWVMRNGQSECAVNIEESEGNGEIVGIVGDMHAPFTHPRYFDFICETFERKGVTWVHFAGDIVDNHASSYHESDPDGPSAGDELTQARDQLQRWYRAFPHASVSIGNHDAIPWRKAQTAGMSSAVLKNHREMYGCPIGWRWEDSTIIDGVLYTHGTGNSGMFPAYNLAKKSLNSVVIGHCHSSAGVKYHASKFARMFGLDVGCGIDVEALAFAYGKHMPLRPVLGCGIVRYGVEAEFVPMPLERFKRGN